MRIWLITTGEPLPVDSGGPRLLRTGNLARYLGSKGHQVVWWTSNFDHIKKQQRYQKEKSINYWPNVEMNLLNGPSYHRNISFMRILNHAVVARRFAYKATQYLKPDVILCALPTIDLAYSAVKYGQKVNVPVVLDVRDLWPDIFLKLLPISLRALGRLALYTIISKTKYSLKNAYSILGVSNAYLRWGLGYAGRSRNMQDKVIPIGGTHVLVSRKDMKRAEQVLVAKGVDPKKIICWFLGSFGKTYDLSTIIQAARQLQQDGITNIQFVFCGDGEMKKKWVSEASGLQNVIFTGWIGNSEIQYLSRVAKIGLQSYARGAPQGLANKLYEYLRAGLPILSSLDGENMHLLKKYQCGLIYRAGDFKDFTHKLKKLLKNTEDLKKMKRNALYLYKYSFSLNKICIQTEQYLFQIVQKYKRCESKNYSKKPRS